MSKLHVIRAIGRVTFFEVVRDKVLYNIIFCAILLMAAGTIASQLSVLSGSRLLTDFGLTALTASCVILAVFTGAGMLGREFERRTALMALSRPITVLQFVLGKALGLAGVLFVNWALFSLALLVVSAVSGGPALPSATLAWALVLALVQSWVLGSIAIFFSSISTTSLSAVFTLGLFLVGHNISQLRWLATRAGSPASAAALRAGAAVLPNFENFSLGTRVAYDLPVSFIFGAHAVAYGAALCAGALLAAGLLAGRKES